MGGFNMNVGCLVVITVVAAMAAAAESAISCGQVLSSVGPCLGYLQGGGAVPPPCCDGAKSLFRAAPSTADRRAVCGCVKALAPRVGAKSENINAVITKCGIPIPFRYSPSIDCSRVV